MKLIQVFTIFLCIISLFLSCGCGDDENNLIPVPTAGINTDAQDEPLVEVRQMNLRAGTEDYPVYQLYVNGSPHDIKGATFQGQNRITFEQTTYDYVTKDMVSAGVNSIRTYGSSYQFDTPDIQAGDAESCFNMARNAGSLFTVIIGLDMLPHSDTGTGVGSGYLNYNDSGQVNKQYGLITQTVDAIMKKNQSPQIGWCVGNEIITTNNGATKLKIYQEIDRIAAYIKTKSTLPVMTSVPNVTSTELNYIDTNTKNLDWIAVNSYYGTYGNKKLTGFLDGLAQNFKASNWKKPWIVSEFASYTVGWTDAGVTLNGKTNMTLLANSTVIAQDYIDSYNYISNAENNAGCLGGYVLSWEPPVYGLLNYYFDHMYAFKGHSGPFSDSPGDPQQNTPDRTQCVEAIRQAYGGSGNFGQFPQIVTPEDGDPQGMTCIFKATLNAQPSVGPNTQQEAKVKATNATSDATVQWYLEQGAGGLDLNSYNCPSTRLINGENGTVITTNNSGGTIESTINFKVPSSGNYRIRAIVRNNDGNTTTPTGNGATASAAFQVK